MEDDKTMYAPFILFEHDEPGNFSLMLGDTYMVEVMEVFDENGRYGNGYAWTDVTVGMIREEAPQLEKLVDFDPEAGMFVAMSKDVEALKTLGEMLSAAFADPKRLATLVKQAPWEWD